MAILVNCCLAFLYGNDYVQLESYAFQHGDNGDGNAKKHVCQLSFLAKKQSTLADTLEDKCPSLLRGDEKGLCSG